MSIVLTELSKRYGRLMVLSRVSLTIEEGELFVLLGGSGSGKTTVLRIIAGLVLPDGGRVELGGRDVTWARPQERDVGLVFQNYSLFRHMSVADNVEFGLRIRKVRALERRRRREELLELVGLAGLGDRFPHQLSGGQQQRVAVARALAYRPTVLLLDEPFGALDVKIRGQLRQSLKGVQRQLSVTTVLVTHDQEEAFELADRIGVIERGWLVEMGGPEELYLKPRTEFAATFVGGGNVVVGRVEGGQIRLGEARLPMPHEAPQHPEGATARVLFRPESVLLSREQWAEGAGVHRLGEGTVGPRVFAGSVQRFRVRIPELSGTRPLSPAPRYGEPETIIEAAQPTWHGGTVALQEGERVWVGLRAYHVLEPSGLRLLVLGACSEDPATEQGVRLGHAMQAQGTLLSVVPSSEWGTAAHAALDALRHRWPEAQVPQMEVRVRVGDPVGEVLEEIQEGHFELVVAGRSADGTIGSLARAVLEQLRVPVLLVGAPRREFGSALICTAAGEPGKSDVRFGGRLALRLGSEVTVLHVHREDDPSGRARAERHLEASRATLEALGLTVKTAIGAPPAVERILQVARSEDHDLMVIGAPAPRSSSQLWGHDVASRIVARAERPVLVVPMTD